MNPRIRIGISGWTYTPWRGGAFYPEGLPQKRELEHASRQVGSIEINGSFYSLQKPASYRHWEAVTPDDFVFAVKGSRFITHVKRLRDVKAALANFFASGILLLKQKLGPLLWQLPPNLRYDPELMETFLKLLPRTTHAAAALARQHEAFLNSRASARAPRSRPLRHAIEVRHVSFQQRRFVEQLRKHRIALVVADTAGKWPLMEDITADFIYLRLHGDAELYVSSYSDAALREWARKIRTWHRGQTPGKTALHAPKLPPRHRGRDVFAYFDNDVKVRAPYDAMTLAHRLGLGPAPAAPPDVKNIRETPRTRWPGSRKKRRQA
jgi:uncharacterized protein YecE (DUF72 family)